VDLVSPVDTDDIFRVVAVAGGPLKGYERKTYTNTTLIMTRPDNLYWLRQTFRPCDCDACYTSIYSAQGNYCQALHYFLELGIVTTDFFTEPVTKNIYNDQVCTQRCELGFEFAGATCYIPFSYCLLPLSFPFPFLTPFHTFFFCPLLLPLLQSSP